MTAPRVGELLLPDSLLPNHSKRNTIFNKLMIGGLTVFFANPARGEFWLEVGVFLSTACLWHSIFLMGYHDSLEAFFANLVFSPAIHKVGELLLTMLYA